MNDIYLNDLRAIMHMNEIGLLLSIQSVPFSHGEVYLIQHLVIMFVSDLKHVGGFLLLFHFPLSIKLTINTYLKY
jgi:hypothetical protein